MYTNYNQKYTKTRVYHNIINLSAVKRELNPCIIQKWYIYIHIYIILHVLPKFITVLYILVNGAVRLKMVLINRRHITHKNLLKGNVFFTKVY